MAFWGLKVEPNKWTPFVPPPDANLSLHITQVRAEPAASPSPPDPSAHRRRAALRPHRISCDRRRSADPPPFRPSPRIQACVAGDKVPKDKARFVVKCRAEAGEDDERPEFNLCTLIGGVVESCHLDLMFDAYAEFYVQGDHPVHLTGFFMPQMMPDDEDDEEALGGMYDEDDDDDDSEEDDDEEEDSDEDEDDFGALEEFDEDSEEDSEEDDAPKKTKKGGVVIEEIEEEPEAPAAVKKEKKRAAAEPAAAAPPAKKEKAAPAPVKKEKETPKKAAPAAEEPAKGQLKREFKNGMEIVNVAMGKPGGKQAKPGKKVMMKYVGKLQSGKIFDQTRGNSTFAFRLGVGEVIKGWDVGVDGMRVGDKRRLTIPPAMAYGKKGVKGAIPGGATLIFDVELVNVV